MNIIDIRQASLALSRRTIAAIDELLSRLAMVCRTQPAGRLPNELAGQLDTTIASILQELPGESRNAALIGLAGIRVGLFPEGAPYEPRTPEQRRAAA